MVFLDILAWPFLLVDRFKRSICLKNTAGDALEVLEKGIKHISKEWIEERL